MEERLPGYCFSSILVLLLMFGYHLLLYKYLKCPHTTVIGYENHNKRAWVSRMLQVELKNRGLAVSVISSNISAATALTYISLLSCFLVAFACFSQTANRVIQVQSTRSCTGCP